MKLLFFINALIYVKKICFSKNGYLICASKDSVLPLHTHIFWCSGHSLSEYLKLHLDLLLNECLHFFYEVHEVFSRTLFHLCCDLVTCAMIAGFL